MTSGDEKGDVEWFNYLESIYERMVAPINI